ncbi:c-type cytochrome [Muriicola sp. Z0-33]|uniref:c-type cytochrome n=1 Tax=Muriicola sp. Z0-33 TaxID=2816957 RepID=UPI002238A659|nr:cytochrome c [Muriicola sp. Z0-33]MCW5517234.1 cytochrome c [Muriicola sp. Z0-33]
MKYMIIRRLTILLGGFMLLSMTVVKLNQETVWEVPEDYQNLENPYAEVEDEDRIGRITYSKYCKTCHGSKGKGDGSAAKLLETPVADFSADVFKDQTDGSIYYKVYTGRNEMPGFEKIIREEEDLWLLVNYIKDL